MTAGSFGSTLGVILGENSSSAACSSLAGGDGGGGPTLFKAMSEWLNRAGCARSCLGAGPVAWGVERSDRLTLWRSKSGEVLESSFTASSVMVKRWTSWDWRIDKEEFARSCWVGAGSVEVDEEGDGGGWV